MGKTILLATHQLQFVENADKIILVNQGAVSTFESYVEFIESGSDFSSYLDKCETADTGQLET